MTKKSPGSMLTPGDVVELDLGAPAGSEAGMLRPAVVVTSARILRGGPNVIHVIPLTRTHRVSSVEVRIEPDAHNGLSESSSAQCQHIRSVSTERVRSRRGEVGPVVLSQIRDTLAVLLDL